MKLANRLVLALSLTTLIGAVIVFVVVRFSSEQLLRSFVYQGDRENAQLYALAAAEYWQKNSGWDGVGEYLSQRYADGYVDRVAVADRSGLIVADSLPGERSFLGTVHPEKHVHKGVPVIVWGENVGTVMVGSMIDSSLGYRGDDFLASIMQALFVALLLSEIFAVLCALYFSRSLSRPLVRLSGALLRVSRGAVPASNSDGCFENSTDEIVALGSAFNRMNAELASLEAQKKQIIADSAHELRTPVTLIRGTVEAMLDGIYPTDRQTLRSVHDETLRLSRLIDALDELQLIDSGALKLSLESVDVGEFLATAVTVFRNSISEKSLQVQIGAEERLPVTVQADRLRLTEVLYNLLSNAIRHTPAGGRISVVYRLLPGADGVEIRVEDSGPGIPAAERGKVFNRYYRLDAARSGALGGRGLGLAIAREIAQAHGGSLSCAESVLHGGASFVLRLPVSF